MSAAATEERDRLVVEQEDRTKPRRAAPPARRSRRRGGEHQRLVKASFNLPADELAALKELAERRQTSATQVLREALRTELYIQQLVDSGATLIAKVGRRGREIVFSHMT